MWNCFGLRSYLAFVFVYVFQNVRLNYVFLYKKPLSLTNQQWTAEFSSADLHCHKEPWNIYNVQKTKFYYIFGILIPLMW